MKLPRWLPTDTWVRLAIVPALVFIATAVDHQYLVDFWHHVARGRAIVTEGRLLNHDVFTCTVHGSEFRDANWLTQILYYTVFQCGGLDLVQLVNSATLAVTFFLLVLLCWRRSGSLAVAAAVGIFAFFGSWEVLTLRPQTFSLLLFMLVFSALEASRRRPWLLLAPPLLIGLWANVHGAFPAGIMLVGCYLLAAIWHAWRRGPSTTDGSMENTEPEAQARDSLACASGSIRNLVDRRDRHAWQLAGCLAASLLATLANPYGWGIYEYVGLTSNRAAARGIVEWLPPTFDLMSTWAGVLSLLAVAGLLLRKWLRCRRLPNAQDVCLMLCFLPLACRSVRMIVWWLIAVAPLLSSLVAELMRERQQNKTLTVQTRPQVAATVIFGLILLAVLVSAPGLQAYNPLLQFQGRAQPRTEADLDAVCCQLQAQHKAGPIFTRFEWSEYCGWAAPAFPVFMDGRIEIYPDAVWNEYVAVSRGDENWQEVLAKYHVQMLVLDAAYHRKTGLLTKVEISPHWQRIFQVRDEICVFAYQPNSVSPLKEPRTE